ncbi:MAG: GNAT family N-acetyltransferase [Candidatus Binatia bacterium]
MVTVQKYVGLEMLPSSYQKLFAQAGKKNFFLSLPWFQNFTRTVLEQDDRVWVYGIESSDSVVSPLGALLLWARQRPHSWLSPVILQGLSNYYSCYFGPVLADEPGNLEELAHAWTKALWTDRDAWDVFNIRPLDVDTDIYPALLSALKDGGLLTQTYFCFGNWYLAVNERSYKEYFDNLPSPMKSTLKRKTKKFRQHNGARIEIVTKLRDVDTAIADYEKVYKASWKTPEPYSQFMPGLIRTCAEAGWLRLGIASVNGEPIAAQVWIVNGEVASIYKLAYDERFAQFSAGSILTAQLMEYVLDEDRVREVDYLSGDDDYKQTWMSDRRERWGILAFNPRSMRGLAQATLHVGGRGAKHALVRLLGEKRTTRFPTRASF